MIIGIQKHNSFFPARRRAIIPASATLLTFSICSSYLLHFYVVYFLHSVFYLGLVSTLIHFKAVGAFHIRKVHSLLCNQRLYYYTIVIHTNFPYLILQAYVILNGAKQI